MAVPICDHLHFDMPRCFDEAFEQERAQPNTLAWRAAREGRVHAFPQ